MRKQYEVSTSLFQVQRNERIIIKERVNKIYKVVQRWCTECSAMRPKKRKYWMKKYEIYGSIYELSSLQYEGTCRSARPDKSD